MPIHPGFLDQATQALKDQKALEPQGPVDRSGYAIVGNQTYGPGENINPNPVPTVNEGARSTTTSDDINEGDVGEMVTDRAILGPMTPMPVIPTKILSGENYTSVGGARGQERFGNAYDNSQARAEQATNDAANVEQDESKQLEETYKGLQAKAENLNAVRMQHVQNAIAEQERRQQEIEKRSQVYTQNLADRGAFWANPGNVLAAIGFALMPFASEDKAIGMKLLNNAVVQDWNHRKQIADTDIGNMQSNLAGYRQLMGDKDAGDQLGLAQAYKQAALEIERISAHYKGPKARATADRMIADLMNRYNSTAMEAYNRFVYMKPQPMQEPMAKAYEGLPGFQSYAKQGQQSGATKAPTGGPVSAGSPSGSPTTSYVPGAVAALRGQKTDALGDQLAAEEADRQWKMSGKKGNPPSQQSWLEKEVGTEGAALLSRRAPGAEGIIKNFRENLELKAWHLTAKERTGDPRHDKKILDAKKAELLEGYKKETDSIAKLHEKDEAAYAGSAMLQQDLRNIKAAFHGNTAAIDEWTRSVLAEASPGTNTKIDQIQQKYGIGGDPAKLAALNRYRQLLQLKINAYYRETSGGTITEDESKRLNAAINSNSPFSLVESWANDRAREHGAKFRSILAGQNSLAGTYYRIRMGQRYAGIDSPGK